MKFVLRYRPKVVANLDAARCWYEERSARLGYVIHDRIEGEMIVGFAIMFGGRDPSAWQGRI